MHQFSHSAHFSSAGTFELRAVVEFDNQIIVSPQSAGVSVSGDQDSNGNVWLGKVTVPAAGAYNFLIMTARPPSHLQTFVGQVQGGEAQPQPPPPPPPPAGPAWERPDVIGVIEQYLRANRLNAWAMPDTPGTIQHTPPYGYGRNRHHVVIVMNPKLRAHLQAQFPSLQFPSAFL